MRATLNSSAFNSKYTILVNSDQIASAFLESFKTEGSCTENVTLVSGEEGADFVLKLVSLDVSESSSTERINDEKSEFYGKDIILSTVSCSAEFELKNVRTKNTSRCRNSKSRSEKVKNNRNIADLIFGTNKDKSNYRTKLLSDNICTHLAQDVGRRIWTPVTRKIARNL